MTQDIETNTKSTHRFRFEKRTASVHPAGRASRWTVTSLLLTGLMLVAPSVHAQDLPQGGSPSPGVNILPQVQLTKLQIQSLVDRGIINWDSFNISDGFHVDFNLAQDHYRLLNRVTGPGDSTIAGKMTSNGIIYIVNPAGVYFTPTATVNVGGIYAAAGAITDTEFEGILGNHSEMFKFTGLEGEVVNEGSIKARDIAVLLGRRVANHGTITTGPGGLVALAAGDKATIIELGTRISVNVSGGVNLPQHAVENAAGSEIKAQGGHIVMAAGDLYSLAIRQRGTLDVSPPTGSGGSDPGGGEIAMFTSDSGLGSGSIEHTGTIKDGAHRVMIHTQGNFYITSGFNAEEIDINAPTLLFNDITLGGKIIEFHSTIDGQHDLVLDASNLATLGGNVNVRNLQITNDALINASLIKAAEELNFGGLLAFSGQPGGYSLEAGDMIRFHGNVTSTDGDLAVNILNGAAGGPDAHWNIIVGGNISSFGNLTLGGHVLFSAAAGVNQIAEAGVAPAGGVLTILGDVRRESAGDLTLRGNGPGAWDMFLGGSFIETVNGNLILDGNANLNAGDGVHQTLTAGSLGNGILTINGDVARTAAGAGSHMTLAGTNGILLHGDVWTTNGDLTFENSVGFMRAGTQSASAHGGTLWAKSALSSSVSGDLFLLGDTAVNLDDNVTVLGNGSLDITGLLTAGGDLSADQNVTVHTDGASVAGNVSGIAGNVQFAADSTVGGFVFAGQNVTFGDNGTVGNEVTAATGSVLFGDNGTVGLDVFAGQNVTFGDVGTVGGNVTATDGTVLFGDGASIGEDVFARLNVTFGHNGTVAGNVTAMLGNVLFGNSGTVSQDVSAGQNVTFGNNGTVGGNVEAGDNVTFGNNGTVGGVVTAQTGSVLFGHNAAVAGNIFADQNVTFGNDATAGANVSALSGDVLFGDRGMVAGSIFAGQNVTFGVDGTVGGNVTAGTGDVEFGDGAAFGGNVSAGNNVRLLGSSVFNGVADQQVVAQGGLLSAAGNIEKTTAGNLLLHGLAGLTLGGELVTTSAGDLTLDGVTSLTRNGLQELRAIAGWLNILNDLSKSTAGNLILAGSGGVRADGILHVAGGELDVLNDLLLNGGLIDNAGFRTRLFGNVELGADTEVRSGNLVVFGNVLGFDNDLRVTADQGTFEGWLQGLDSFEIEGIGGPGMNFGFGNDVDARSVSINAPVVLLSDVTFTGIDLLRFGGTIDSGNSPAYHLVLISDGEIVLEDAVGGDSPLGSLTVGGAGLVRLNGGLIRTLGDIAIREQGRPTPATLATIVANRSIRIESLQGEFRMGRNEKFTSLGDLVIIANSARIGDLSAAGDLEVTAPLIVLLLRDHGDVVGPDDVLRQDRGLDFVAGGSITFTGQIELDGDGMVIFSTPNSPNDVSVDLVPFLYQLFGLEEGQQMTDVMFDSAGNVLDLRAQGPTNDNLSEALAAVFPDDTEREAVEQGVLLDPAMRQLLEVYFNISARDMFLTELFELVAGVGLIEGFTRIDEETGQMIRTMDRPDEPVLKVSRAVAARAIDLREELGDADPPVVNVVSEAWSAYLETVDDPAAVTQRDLGIGFRRFLDGQDRRDPHPAAGWYVAEIERLIGLVDAMGLTRPSFDRSRTFVLDEFSPVPAEHRRAWEYAVLSP